VFTDLESVEVNILQRGLKFYYESYEAKIISLRKLWGQKLNLVLLLWLLLGLNMFFVPIKLVYFSFRLHK
jgi:hypothetical protein